MVQTDAEKDLLFLIQGVANSTLMAQYHDLCFNNKLYSGRRRYLSQYIEKYPIPTLNNIFSKRIVEIVKLLNSKNYISKTELENELNACVLKSFVFTD